MEPWFKSTVLGLVVTNVSAKSLIDTQLMTPTRNLVSQRQEPLHQRPGQL